MDLTAHAESLPRLHQAEWCPASARVRQRLTELDVAYVALQVPVEREARAALRAATGADTIPALLTGDGAVLVGEDDIIDYLDRHYPEPTGALAHRVKAASRQGGEGASATIEGGSGMAGEQYALTAESALGFDETVARVREELETEGFGVLTEIDAQETLRKKLGVETERYLILGACNPSFAHQALELEPELGVLLPCNVVVYARGERTLVSAVDAQRMLSIVGNDELTPVASEVRSRLARVVERVAQASA